MVGSHSSAVAQGVTSFYTSFFRGTPLIVQMFLIFLALPQLAPPDLPGLRDSLTLTALQAGIIALGLNYGAYMTEIFRAGIQSVGHGQVEAAEALGMTYRQRMRRIVLPQAIRVIIPPTGNEFIAMMKDSALISLLGSVVAQMEIFRRAQLVGRADFRPLEAFVVAAALYWVLTTIFQFFQTRLERSCRPDTCAPRSGSPPSRASRWSKASRHDRAGGQGERSPQVVR